MTMVKTMIATRWRPSRALPRVSLLSLIRLMTIAMVVVSSHSLSTVDERRYSDKAPSSADPNPAAVIAPGIEKPLISLGTGGGMYGKRADVEKAVLEWLQDDVGGRGLDTAIDYGNDDLVGTALVRSGIPREQVFITTKQPGPIGFNETIVALEQSLVRLQTSYVDLYLIHFPDPDPPPDNRSGRELRQETWRAMEEVLNRGLTRSIGVSNYKISDLWDTLQVATVTPAVNQVLWNPASHDDSLLEFCQTKGITLEAWSPLGGHDSRHGNVLDLPIMKRIAASHGVTTAQVALRWTLQHGMTLATGTTKEDHMITDLDVFGFRLTDKEILTITEIQNSTMTAAVPATII